MDTDHLIFSATVDSLCLKLEQVLVQSKYVHFRAQFDWVQCKADGGGSWRFIRGKNLNKMFLVRETEHQHISLHIVAASLMIQNFPNVLQGPVTCLHWRIGTLYFCDTLTPILSWTETEHES